MSKLFSRLLFSIMFMVVTIGWAAYGLKEMSAEIKRGPQPGRPRISGAAALKDSMVRMSLDHVPFKSQLSDLYYHLQLLMGKREYNNFTVVKIEDGILNLGSFIPPELDDTRTSAKYYQGLKNTTENAGGRLIVYNPPIRPDLPSAPSDTGIPQLDLNPRIDAFMHHLREYGVDLIDGRYKLSQNEAETPPQYKTDLLWTSQAGFVAFGDLVKAVADKYQKDLDPEGFYRDKGNYRFKTYPKFFMGVLGLRSNHLVAGFDDFTAVIPKFKNNYSVEFFSIKHGFVRREGESRETIYYPEVLQKSPLDENGRLRRDAELPYNYYLRGLHSMITIKNEDHPERPRILLIHDAFGLPLGCFLAPMAGELVLVNSVSQAYVPELNRYIADRKFDLVIVLNSIYSL